MIDRSHDLPLVRQAELLRLSRSRLYYEPRPVAASELAIMRRIDELHLDYPFAGSRMMRDLLRDRAGGLPTRLLVTHADRAGAPRRHDSATRWAPGAMSGRGAAIRLMRGRLSSSHSRRPSDPRR